MLENLLDPRVILVRWPVFLFSLSLHEYLHAWSAWRLGDPTARSLGRLTLNPVAHFDPIGTTCGLLFHIGWAKPVPVNPAYFRRPRRDDVLVSLGGPLSNFALAACCVLVFKVVGRVEPPGSGWARSALDFVEKAAAYGVFLNLVLGLFNLIPLFPLDGFHVLRGMVPPSMAEALDRTRWMSSILLLGIIIGGVPVVWPAVGSVLRLAFTRPELARFADAVRTLL